MHVLVRGDLLQRLRLLSGLVLFAFVLTHFLNHALGLISLEAVEGMQAWRKVVTRSRLGSAVLLAAFLVHIALALYKTARRLTWKMPFWELTQTLAGFAIPLLLLDHVIYNRGAASLAGTLDTYTYELGNIWPSLAWEQALLLIVVWTHACIGLHYWLRLARWYERAQAALLALAVALPVAALAGFTVAARQVAAQLQAPGAWDKLQAASRAPGPEALDKLTLLHDGSRIAFLALLAIACLLPVIRPLRRAIGPKVEVTYRSGPRVRAPLGPTLLEVSRMHKVPHTSVCGGRGRCSTCRVVVERGLAALDPPSSAEAATLASVKAPPHVRLACQVRAREPVTVMRIVTPPEQRRTRRPSMDQSQGIERNLAVLFVDARGFTSISEKRLPYDVVFILNRLFAEVGEVIEHNGGIIDKYLGDGLMALFGTDSGEAEGCRQALSATRGIDFALDRLNSEMQEEIGAPLKLGMGVEVGPLVMGRIGHVRSAAVTVIGNTVNTASRLESLTKEKGCQLVVSTDVLSQAGVDLTLFPRESIAIRGLTVPREVALVPRARDLPDIPGSAVTSERPERL